MKESFTPDKLTGTANATFRDWTVLGVHLETTRLQATLVDGRVFFDRKTSPSLEALRAQSRGTRALGSN